MRTSDQPEGVQLVLWLSVQVDADGQVTGDRIVSRFSDHPDPAFINQWIKHTQDQVRQWQFDHRSTDQAELLVGVERTVGAAPRLLAIERRRLPAGS